MKTRSQRRANSNAQNANGQVEKRFLDPLPFEITILIASYLNESDCLKCMAVCRSWYATVPEYMEHVWKTMCITYSSLPENNKRWERCVSVHTKRLELIDDGGMYTSIKRLRFMMRKLIGCNCGPFDSLELTLPPKIKSKAQILSLLVLLQKLTGPSIPQLTINSSSTSVNLFDALCAYPNIRQFSFRDIRAPGPTQHTPPAAVPEFIHLTRLFLDVNIIPLLQLEPILRNSPNLQYLSYIRLRPTHTSTPYTLQPDSIFSLCPKLVYLETGARCISQRYRNKALESIKQSKLSGLSGFINCENGGYKPNQMEQLFTRNRSTLEFVVIQYRTDWTHVLSPLSLLRVLVLHFSEIDTSTFPDLVLPGFPALEELNLTGSIHRNRSPRFELFLLRQMPKLKSLTIAHLTLRYDENTFKNLATQGIKLISLALDTVFPMTDTLLKEITRFSTLKQLSISSRSNSLRLSLIELAQQLKRTAIQELELNVMTNLSTPVLRALGELPSLRYFEISQLNPFISPFLITALIEMLSANTSLKRMTVVQPMWIRGIKGDAAMAFLQNHLPGYQLTTETISRDMRYLTAVSVTRI